MLVLTRQRGETIFIGEVQVSVAGFTSSAVRLRITAPRDIPVHRQEVHERDRREKLEPADTVCDDDQGTKGNETRQSHLVLSRRYDETIMIGDDIKVTVVDICWDIRGDQVRLGITAPRDIPIYREEVREAILRQKQPPLPHAAPSGSTDPCGAESEIR